MAWRYILFNKGKTTILIACLMVVMTLPMALHLIVTCSKEQLTSRANETPLVIGSKGSALDVVMNTLYFTRKTPNLTSMGEVFAINQTNLAYAIPIYNRFHAAGYPIIGTSLDYFSFRALKLDEGSQFTFLGECVIGCKVAKSLGLKVGDHLISSPENMFDLSGTYPLRLQIVGILQPAHSPDDQGIFVDVKTSWVIGGLGHGHKDLAKSSDSSVLLSKNENTITANAKLLEYNEITKDNIDSFHFHGDNQDFPLTSIIAVPHDLKSKSILRGRYQESEQSQQAIIPIQVVDELIEAVFSIKSVLDIVLLIVGAAMLLAMTLIMVLSLRMRQREMETIAKLGCKQMKVVEMMTAEIALIIFFSLLLSSGIVLLIYTNQENLIQRLII